MRKIIKSTILLFISMSALNAYANEQTILPSVPEFQKPSIIPSIPVFPINVIKAPQASEFKVSVIPAIPTFINGVKSISQASEFEAPPPSLHKIEAMPIKKLSSADKSKKVIKKVVKTNHVNNASNEKIFKLPANITGIRTTSNINYHIIVGSEGPNQMTVKANPISLKAIHYEVKNGVLHVYYQIKNHDILKRMFHANLYRAEIFLRLKTLNSITQEGWSSIQVRYYRSQSLSVDKWGSGSLMVKGNAIRLIVLKNGGTGNVTINRIYSNGLYVYDYGSGLVTLVANRVNLRQLTTNNSGNITINNIRSNLLNLDVDNDATIKLTGEFKVANINYSGSGNMQMYWAKGNNIFINTDGSGTLAIAGVTKIINAFAYGRSHLDLRYLRTKDAFISSFDDASVDVWVYDNLYALADNNSNIYYFSQPKYMSRMMRGSGSVLPMADIPNSILTFNTQGSIRGPR